MNTRELVDIKFAVLEALGLGEACLKLNELVREEMVKDVDSPMAKVLSIAKSRIQEEEKKSWLNVLSISQRLNSGDASSAGVQPTSSVITKEENSSSPSSSHSSTPSDIRSS